MQIYQVLNLDVTKFSILMRSKFSGSHASLNIVTLCSEYVCTCHDMTLYGRVTLLVHTGERIRVWYGRVSHGIFTNGHFQRSFSSAVNGQFWKREAKRLVPC